MNYHYKRMHRSKSFKAKHRCDKVISSLLFRVLNLECTVYSTNTELQTNRDNKITQRKNATQNDWCM